MSMPDALFEALQNITRYQQDSPNPCVHDEVEVVKLAMNALRAKLDCMSAEDLDPRSRTVLKRLVEHLKPLIPPEGVFVPIAGPDDEDAQAREEEMEERIAARIADDRERERQQTPLPTVEPEPFEEPFRRIEIT